MTTLADTVSAALAQGAAPAPVSVTQQKQAEVAQVTTQKKVELGGMPTTADLANLVVRDLNPRMSDRALPAKTQAEADLATLSTPDLIRKYGPDALNLINRHLDAASGYQGRQSVQRNVGEHIVDGAVDVGLGFINTIGGVAAAGAGVLDKANASAADADPTLDPDYRPSSVGVDISKGLSDVNTWAQQHLQSKGLNVRRGVYDADSGFTGDANKVQQALDLENGKGDLTAKLSRVGRDVLDTADNTIHNGAVLESGVANAAGSLVAAGPVIKAVGAVSEPLAALVAVGSKGPSKAGFLISKAAGPASVGLMEGGGAYQQTASAIANMSHDQLLAGSDAYKAYLDHHGDTVQHREDARNLIANDAGLAAGAIQGVAALPTGALVAKFEKNPFAVTHVGEALTNVLKEGVEEGTQSASGQLAQNYETKKLADRGQDILDGVGEQTAQGAIYGMGSAGAVEGPTLAGHTPVAAVGATISALATKGRALTEKTPVDTAALNQVHADIAAQAPEVQAEYAGTTNAPVEAGKVDPVTAFMGKIGFDPAETANAPAVVQEAVKGAENRFQALSQVAEATTDWKGISPAEKVQLAGYLAKGYSDFRQTAENGLIAAVEHVSDDDPVLAKLRGFEQTVTQLQQHPAVQAAMDAARTAMDKPAIQDQFSVQALGTPEGIAQAQHTADGVLELTKAEPEKANLDLLNTIRQQAAVGVLQLTPEQTSTLEAASALVKATQERLASYKANDIRLHDQVSGQVQSDEIADPEDPTQVVKSAVDHGKGIMASLNAGDLETAKLQMQDLGLFAQHFQNKIAALNTAYASGDTHTKVPFQALSPNRELGVSKTYKTGAPNLIPTSVGSVQLAQSVGLDAKAVTDVHNGFVKAFPQLGGEHIENLPLALDPGLNRNAADIVAEHKTAVKEGDKPDVETKQTTEASTSNAVQSEEVKTEREAKTEVAQPDTVEEPVEPVSEPTQVAEKAAEPKVEAPKAELPAREESTVVAPQTEKIIPSGKAVPEPIGSKQFQAAFQEPKTVKSRLVGLGDQVLTTVAQALKSADSFREMLGGKKLTHDFDAVKAAYSDFLNYAPSIQKVMEDRLVEYLSGNKVEGKTFGDAIAEGFNFTNPPETHVRGKALNITQVVDGKVIYNPELVQSAVLAGVQWLIDAYSRAGRDMDEEEIGKLLGIDENEVTPLQVDAFNTGVLTQQAVQQLTAKITEFWGVDLNPGVEDGLVKGIPEAVAKEVLKALDKTGLIQLYAIDFDGNELTDAEQTDLQKSGETTTNKLKISGEPDIQEALKEASQFPTALDYLVQTDPEEIRFIGEPPKKVAQFQLKNRLVKNTTQQVQAIKNEQATEHRINEHMLGFMEAISKAGAVFLFGEGDLADRKLNANHALSLKGVNTTIESAYDAMVAMAAEVRNKSTEAGVSPYEMPIHYVYEVSKVGRLQMQGSNNPQSSKLMREVILPTRVTMDLSKVENYNKFMLAVAQALGVKVHKQTRQASVDEIEQLLNERGLAKARNILSLHLLGERLDEEDLHDLKLSFGDRMSPAVVHAVIEYERLAQVDDASKFTTDLYVEADGVTNGPINALYHLSTGPFTSSWLQLMKKGGLYVGADGMTVNQHVQSGQEGASKDVYQSTTDETLTQLQNLRSKLPEQLRSQSTALGRMMDALLPDVTFNEKGEFELGRGLVKNPLTVTIYGAGINGISAKVVGAITAAFYEELSKAAEGLPNKAADVRKLMDRLTSSSVSKSKAGDLQLRDQSEVETSKKTSDEDYTLTKAQLKNLKSNVRHLFVQPMQDAIEATIQDTAVGRNALKTSVQVQSIFFKQAFAKAVDARLEEKAKDPAYKKSNFLSQNELSGILTDLKAKYPLIETGSQTFFPGGNEKSDVKTTEFARSLSGDLTTPAYVYGPTNAGVAGIPYITIGTGDGQMMLNLAAGANQPQGTLKVFDGIHLKLDTLDEDAVKVNQAVYDSWQESPLSSVNEAFSLFAQGVDVKGMSLDDVLEALGAFHTPTEIEQMSADYSLDELKADLSINMGVISKDLAAAAASAEARHVALSQVKMSVDQMASAEQPYSPEGKIDFEGKTDEEIAKALNDLAAKPAATPVVEQTEEAPGTPIASSIKVIKALDFRKLALTLVPAEQRNLMVEMARALAKTSWEMVTGTKADLEDFARRQGSEPPTAILGGYAGYINLNEQRIYVPEDATSETKLHEIIHAATTQKILDHYRDPATSTHEVSQAIGNLEQLMAQWIDAGVGLVGMNAETKQAYRLATSQMNAERNNARRTDAENRAAALDEFLAWNLSNQHLIKLAQGSKAENPLVRVAKSVLIALKNLIWGRKNGPMVRTDMYSALRFNASTLINSAGTLQYRASQLTRQQSIGYGQNDRLTQLNVLFARKIGNFLDSGTNPGDRMVDEVRVRNAQALIADQVTEAFIDHGFHMDMQQKTAFQMMMTVMSVQAKLDKNALARVHELYTHFEKNLPDDAFRDPTDPDQQANEHWAGEKRRAVLGEGVTQIDAQGRSTLMPAFLALAMVNDEFRAMLAKLPLSKSELHAKTSLDNILFNTGISLMDKLAQTVSGEGKQTNVRDAIDTLTDRLAANTEDQQDLLSKLTMPPAGIIDQANTKVSEALQKTAKFGIEKLNDLSAKTNNKHAQTVLSILKATLAIANEEEAKILAEGANALATRTNLWRPIREGLADAIGRTGSNAAIYDMIKLVSKVVSQMRQQYREHVPGVIASKFSRALTDGEWTHLHNMARADIASLASNYTSADILKMLTKPSFGRTQARALEGQLTVELGSNWPVIQAKAKQLANYMVTGVHGDHLLTNAEAVARLLGVPKVKPSNPTSDVIEMVDHLVTLYALDQHTTETKNTLQMLAHSEGTGVSFLVSYLEGQRNDELAKFSTDTARMNHYKGYLPSESQKGVRLIVADDSEQQTLGLMAFKRVADYQGSNLEAGRGKFGYYFAPVSGKATFDQGIMQNVRTTAAGVDPVTGLTSGPMTAGRITDPRRVSQINRLANVRSAQGIQNTGSEPLVPRFNENGSVKAYERAVDPLQEERLNRSTHLAKVVGAWRGRQMEESMGSEINNQLVTSLKSMWDAAKASGDTDLYIDLLKSKDPIIKDAVSLFTKDTLAAVKEQFGSDGFMVRDDLVNNAIGYRSASVGDLWTGNTRFDPKLVDVTKNALTGIFGVDAYKILTTGEQVIQNLVTNAKQSIVIKSVVVPVSNMASNIYQLAGVGVGINRIVKSLPSKLSETNAYVKRRVREIEIEAELRAATGDHTLTRKLKAEGLTIRDANSRMSIWPLIQAGELTAISDAGVVESADVGSLYEGKLVQYFESLIDRLPKPLSTITKNVLVTRETALFKGMEKAMEYGDFLAKAILYDHLTEQKNTTPADALAQVSEEFVSYEYLPGRTGSYADSLGLTWFYKYKVRIAKVAVSMLRNNPIHALLTSLVPQPHFLGTIGSPLSDNVISLGLEGKLHWSLGPGMLLNSVKMNPVVELLKAAGL